ncbi:MAG: alpha/beta hydrolase [Chitinophagales bacterium]
MLKRIEYKGVQCVYRTEGRGKVVMLVHGFIEEGSMWNDVVKLLSKTYKVIVPDLPGFGKSGLLPEISMEIYADYVKAICNKEKIKKLTLLGHSMGGYVTLNFAEQFPERLNGFGLLNSHCFEDAPEKKENRKKGIEFIRKYGSKPFVTELYNSIFHDNFKKKNRRFIDGLIKQASAYSPEALMLANAAMMNRKDKQHVLKNTNVPVLIIGGKKDGSAPLDLVLKQASMPAVADIHIYAEAKHMSIFERKKEALAAIKAFCERVN